MRLATSTLGAPGIGLETVLGWLADADVEGIEFRAAAGELVEPGMSAARRRLLRTEVEAAGMTVTGISSYVRIASPGPDAPVLNELTAALELAHDLGAPAVRVFPGAGNPGAGSGPDRADEAIRRAARRLSDVAVMADAMEVTPVIETHDSHPTGSAVAAIASQVEGPVGVVWDLMHPWRAGESLEDTWSALMPWLSRGMGSVQIKDAEPDGTPAAIGSGTLPCGEFGDLLKANGYSGTVTLELEAAWYQAAPPLPLVLASARSWLDDVVGSRAGA